MFSNQIRNLSDEKDLSTVQDQKKEEIRVPRADGDPRWEGCDQKAQSQGTETSHAGLTPLPGAEEPRHGKSELKNQFVRLRLKSEFDYVKSHGNKSVGRLMIVLTAPSPDGLTRYGVICGRKFSKRAVDRNRARRLLWESHRLLSQGLRPVHALIIPRLFILNRKEPEVRCELKRILADMELWGEPLVVSLSG